MWKEGFEKGVTQQVEFGGTLNLMRSKREGNQFSHWKYLEERSYNNSWMILQSAKDMLTELAEYNVIVMWRMVIFKLETYETKKYSLHAFNLKVQPKWTSKWEF